jgi:two-component SAPR family response regulator
VKLLILDDDRASCAIFEKYMSSTFEVKVSHLPSEALKLLAEESIEVVIADGNMEEMNGVDFLKQVSEKFPATIRILVSGYMCPSKDQNYIHAYFEKGNFSIKDLTDQIFELIK